MPSSFIDSERGKGLCCCPGAAAASLPSSPVPAGAGWGEAVSPARDKLAVQPLGRGRGWHVPPHGTGPVGAGRRGRWPQLPLERHAAEQTGAEQTCGSPNSSDLRKDKITNIFHSKLQLNLEVLWLQGTSFPTLSWSDLQIPPLSSLVKM